MSGVEPERITPISDGLAVAVIAAPCVDCGKVTVIRLDGEPVCSTSLRQARAALRGLADDPEAVERAALDCDAGS
jgi:hypothetical protein